MSTTDVAPLRWVRYDGVYYAALLIPNNESPMHVPDEHCFVFFLDGESGAVVPESDVESYDPHNLTRASHPDAVAGVALAEQILHGPTHAYSSPANTEVANNNNNSSSNNYKLDTRYDPTGVFAGNEDVALDEELELVYSPDDFYHNHNYNNNNNNGSSNNDNITNAIDRERKVYTSAEHLGKENTEELLSNEMQETHSHAREYQEQEQERNRRHSQHQQREHRHGHSHHRKKKSHKEHHSRSKVKHESVTLENEEDNESSDNNNNNNNNSNNSSHRNKSHEVIATGEELAEEDHINKDNVTVEQGRNNHWREMEEEYYNNDNDNDGVVHVDNNNNHFRGDSNDREIMNRPTYRRGKTFRSGGLMSEALNALHSHASLVAPYLAQIRYYYKELREEAERSNRLLSVQEADVVREVEYLLHATAAKIRFLEQVHTTHVLQSDTLSHAEKHNAEQVLKETIRNLRNAVNMEHIIRELVQFIDKPPETKPEAKRRPLHMERFAFHDASIAFMLRNTLTNAIPREFTQELANKYREQRLWRERQLSLNNGLGKTGFYAIPKPMEHWNRSKELMVISHAPENQPVKPTGYIPRRFSESINKVEQNAIKRFTGQSSRDNMQMSREPLSMSEAAVHGTNMYNNSLPSFMTTANNLVANTLAAASINFNNNNGNNSTTSASSNVATNNNNTNNNTVTAGTSAAFQSPSRRLGQNYPAYYNFHDLAPSQTNDLERYRANGLASANGVLGPVNLVDSYFNEQHSLPLEHEQEPLITPLHMGVDPNVDFAIEPDEVRDERREYGSNLHSNSRSYLYSASIRLPSQESHLYSVESTTTIQASEPYAHSATNQSNTNNNNNNNNISSRPFYSVDYMDDTGGVPAPKSVPQEQQHHHHHHHHHRSKSKNRSRSRSRSATTSRHVSRASSAASSVFSSSASASSHKSLSSAKAHKHRRHSRSRHRSKDISNSKSTNNRHKVSSRASVKKTNNTNTTAAMAIGGSKKKLDWRESAKRAILEQLTLYLRGLKGKTAVLSYDNFESVARKLLERAVSRESERTGVSMTLQANNNSIPFLRETELMLKRSVDSYVTRHFIEPFRHASTKHSLRHRSAAQTMSQPHYEQLVNDNDRNNTNEENNHRGAEDSPVYD